MTPTTIRRSTAPCRIPTTGSGATPPRWAPVAACREGDRPRRRPAPGRRPSASPGPADPAYEKWRDLIPQDPEAVLTDFAFLDGLERPVLLAGWTRHAICEITVSSSDGTASI